MSGDNRDSAFYFYVVVIGLTLVAAAGMAALALTIWSVQP